MRNYEARQGRQTDRDGYGKKNTKLLLLIIIGGAGFRKKTREGEATLGHGRINSLANADARALLPRAEATTRKKNI
jgi:hypothetical protein